MPFLLYFVYCLFHSGQIELLCHPNLPKSFLLHLCLNWSLFFFFFDPSSFNLKNPVT
jgi:hypothetical protein